MQRRYKAIVFDLGNVLIPFDYTRIVKNLNAIEAGLGHKFYRKYMDNYEIHRRYERWDLSDEEFIGIMLQWLDNKISSEKFCQVYSDLFTVDSNVAGLLPILKDKYKLVLLSNTNHIHQKYGWGKYDFLKYFDGLILSHEVGSTKPEKKIYRAVEKVTLGLPEQHFYIDDIEEYIQAAEKLGWNGIVFKGYDDLITNLKSRNIL